MSDRDFLGITVELVDLDFRDEQGREVAAAIISDHRVLASLRVPEPRRSQAVRAACGWLEGQRNRASLN